MKCCIHFVVKSCWSKLDIVLYFEHCLYLDIVCGSTKVDLLYIGCCLHPEVDSLAVETL